MKTIKIFLPILLSFNYAFAQSTDILSEDEKVRIKLAVHLVTYDTIGNFDNAAGMAYFKLSINSFKENLTIPEFSFAPFTANDKSKIESIIQLLNQLKKNPPSWNDLLIRETQYEIWLDKMTHKKSIYKTE